VTPLPAPLGAAELAAWRLDDARFAATWDSGEGAFLFGGRWNSPGVRAVYCSIDPSTAILEVAVHSGFAELAARPHVLTSFTIYDPADVHVVQPTDIPEPAWLRSIETNPAQQRFGDDLLTSARFVVIPSAVSSNSWNLLMSVPGAAGRYARRSQEPFVLDPRLQSPTR
jgi:RES domain-containing protein